MQAADLDLLVMKAKGGDGTSRELVLERCRPFIVRVASRQAKRFLDWENDDELSVALVALNEAIDAYQPQTGAGFLGFAQVVITRRLVDYFRRQGRHMAETLDGGGWTEDGSLVRLARLEQARREEEAARAEELQELKAVLSTFGISLRELARVAPRRVDARQGLAQAARVLASDPVLVQQLYFTRQLPLAALAGRVRVSRKTLERGRKYLIALAIVLDRGLDHLIEYLKPLFREGRA